MELAIGTEPRREYLSFELARAARKAVEEVMPVKPGENVVITAVTSSDERVVEATAQAVYAVGAHPIVIWYETQGAGDLGRPPAPVAAALEAADVWFEFGGALLYTEARNKAIEAGCRHACYGGMDVDMMVRTIGSVNNPAMGKLGEKLRELSLAATEMHITSPAGTDFRATIDKSAPPYFGERKPGHGYSQMLGGQASFPALTETINGTLVFDGTIAPTSVVGIPRTPVEMTLREGFITDFKGGPEARAYEQWLARFDNKMVYCIAHLSYGFNPGVTRLTGRVVEDERVFGCMDIGVGPTRLGSPVHTDGMVMNASVWADDVQLEDEGVYIHPELVDICQEMGVPGY